MLFVRIKQDHPFLVPIQSWYETSFPPSERRTFNDLLQLLPCPDMHLCGLVDEDQLVGFLIYWHWDEMIFIEHFAIDPNQRGQQLGQRAIQQLCQLTTPYILLEVELPEDDLSRRRIQFYERQGFSPNAYSYEQPPYQRGHSPIPMRLMSMPQLPSIDIFRDYSQLIHKRVYERFY